MGRGGYRKKGRGGRFNRKKGGEAPVRTDYVEIPQENETFEKYYKAQNIWTDEEWTQMMAILKTILPTSFRISGSKRCAAPGSKTAQIVEALHKDDSIIPEGLVIANDADYKRSHMLVHQTSRLQSPCLVVTNHEAQFFPYIYFNKKSKGATDLLQFDRILADVPCSGDGTLRKNRGIWKTWHQNGGNALHKIQLAILQRGCQFLKIGGRIVYSTCTFNPVENEAVVVEMLREANGAMVLQDVSSELPNLKFRPGVTEWKVMDNTGALHSSLETVDEKQKKKLAPSLFASPAAKTAGLEKCIRITPFDQNTGGFFVAVFKKVSEYGNLDRKTLEKKGDSGAGVEAGADSKGKRPQENEEEQRISKKAKTTPQPDVPKTEIAESTEKNTEANGHDKDKKEGWAGKGEQPFIFVPHDHDDIKAFASSYGVDPIFPLDQFVVRSDIVPYKTIYLVSTAVRRLLLASNSNSLKVVNTGVRIFTRNSGNTDLQVQFPYRLTSEGIQTLAPHLTSKRLIELEVDDFKVMLQNEYPKFDLFSQKGRELLESLDPGCLILKFTPSEENLSQGSIREVTYFPVWRAGVSASILVPKKERLGLLARLTGEVFEGHRSLRLQGVESGAGSEAEAEAEAEVEAEADEGGAEIVQGEAEEGEEGGDNNEEMEG
ncbi:tRNA (cytosine(34)-C(5))-methyltransferase [Phlyctochytrium planicorne]|nr:tRNA (cytosine(34)-C(5))-methyltransferase [Phlyctochytrium planicorne]